MPRSTSRRETTSAAGGRARLDSARTTVTGRTRRSIAVRLRAPQNSNVEALQRPTGEPDDGLAEEILKKLARKAPKPPRIRCPKCRWQPRKESRWMCGEGCRHSWNTFDTHGVCPACHFRWENTKCHACHQWSKHDDWYERDENEE